MSVSGGLTVFTVNRKSRELREKRCLYSRFLKGWIPSEEMFPATASDRAFLILTSVQGAGHLHKVE